MRELPQRRIRDTARVELRVENRRDVDLDVLPARDRPRELACPLIGRAELVEHLLELAERAAARELQWLAHVRRSAACRLVDEMMISSRSSIRSRRPSTTRSMSCSAPPGPFTEPLM